MKKHDIRPKGNPDIPHESRWEYAVDPTSGKDETADYIYEEIVQAGRWDMDAIEIVEELKASQQYDGYHSRQHVTNTLKQYFEIVPKDGEENEDEDSNGHHVQVPEMDEHANFERGYNRGFDKGFNLGFEKVKEQFSGGED